MTTAHTPTRTGTAVGAPRGWALIGGLAGATALAGVFLSMSLSPAHDPNGTLTPEGLTAELLGKQPLILAFHAVTVASALLLVVFAAGLARRLGASLPGGSLVPNVAFGGLLLVSAAQLLGSGLDTEFLYGLGDSALMLPGDVGMYSHWIATIAWLWAGGGLAALAVGAASLRGGAPRWIGITSFILGSLTVLLALSPLQYMSALPGSLWALVVATGFALGDRRFRHASPKG